VAHYAHPLAIDLLTGIDRSANLNDTRRKR
jgi:hypothetical protein